MASVTSLPWASVSPITGHGDGNIAVTANEHTGREARTGSLTVKTKGGISRTANLTQNGAPLFVTLTSPATMTPTKAGGVVTFSGESNSPYVAYGIVNGGSGIALMGGTQGGGRYTKIDTHQYSYTQLPDGIDIGYKLLHDIQVSTIGDDYGKAEKYTFTSQFFVDINSNADPREFEVWMFATSTGDNNGILAASKSATTCATIVCTQAGADSTLMLNGVDGDVDITAIDADDTSAKTISVTSNDDWSVQNASTTDGKNELGGGSTVEEGEMPVTPVGKG